MRMRVHVKLIILFVTGWIFVAEVGIAVNVFLQKRSDEQRLKQKKDQIEELSERIQNQLYDIEMQVLEWSVSNEINMFNMYNWEKNSVSIYEDTKTLYRQLQGMKSNNECMSGAWLIFSMQDRQITDRVRYDVIDRNMYEIFRSEDSGFVMEDSILYYVSWLSVNLGQSEKSLAAAGVSLPRLLDEISLPVDGVEMRLTFLGKRVAGSSFDWEVETAFTEEWKKRKNGWTITYPVAIDHDEKQTMYLEAFLPAASLSGSRQSYLIWSAVLMLVGALAIFYFCVLLRRIVMRPLNMLIEAFGDVADGKMNVRICCENKDEFSRIYQHFNEIVNRLNTLIEKEYKASIIAKNAEIKYLQAQMKPHFLYNSFYQIYRMCRAEGAEESAEFALLLSKYFEYVTRSGDAESVVMLFEEVCQAERYVQIQRFRYGERLQVFFDIPENIRQYRVPKFILQPVLENAVKYCYEKQKIISSVIIKVTGRRRDNFLEILIEDNGNMVDPSDIAAMQQKLYESVQCYKNSGLVNVHLRLKMLSSKGGITLSRSELGGLLVKMEIYN